MREIDLVGTNTEQEKSSERYRMVMVGGRVKTAGASFRHLYDAASPLIQAPDSIDAAFETSKRFARLKEKPPLEIRMAFFPQDERSVRTAFKGLGIYRPTIKTDQGPAGNVGYFYIDGFQATSLQGQIVKEEGVAVVERFLQTRIDQAFLSDKDKKALSLEISTVQQNYQMGNYRKAYEGVLKLRELGFSNGIETTRKAGVGRQEFFFFRPVQTQDRITIGQSLVDAISARTQEVVNKIERLAGRTKQFVRQGLSIQEAISKAYQTQEESLVNGYQNGLLYFQPDVLIRKDGSFDIERISMPDLGMFLTEIKTPSQNGALEKIQTINRRIKDEVLDGVCENVGTNVVLVTRDKVLDNCEDTLEQVELVSFGQGIEERGKKVKITSLKTVDGLPVGSSIILFNIDTENSYFERLLHRVASGEIQCFPDPFMKLFEKDATTYPRIKVEGQVLDKFLNLIAPTALDKPEGVHRKFKSIQSSLRLGGIDEDIVYFQTQGNNGNYIPTFRYDVKTFSEVYKAVESERVQGGRASHITAVPVPFKPEDAVIEGRDGPRLAVFRFMFVKK